MEEKKKKPSQVVTKRLLQYLYLNKFKTAAQTAEELGLKEHNILFYLKKYRIRKVERWERYGIKKFSKIQKEYLYGSLLGDDCLILPPEGRYPHLQVSHSSRFKDYVEWKYGFWEELAQNGIRRTLVETKDEVFSSHRFQTAAHPEFLPFYRGLYGSGEKRITRDWLDKLTPLSLAVWYMDDGYFRRSRGRIHFITLAYGKKGNEIIKNYFLKRWYVKTNLQKTTRGQDRYYLWMNTENSIKFTKIIGPYILPCFSYKIDKNRRLKWKKISLEERKYIEDYYNVQSPRLIAKRLERPVSGIHASAWKLGLTQPRGGRKIYQFDIKD